MPETIEYCISNASPDERDGLPAFAAARPCMQECGRCYEGPFLAIDGELVAGDNYGTILDACGGD